MHWISFKIPTIVHEDDILINAMERSVVLRGLIDELVIDVDGVSSVV